MQDELEIAEPIKFENIIDANAIKANKLLFKTNFRDNVNNTKLEIEKRYERLANGFRRPSLEYISVEDIKEIFVKYAINREVVMKLSNEELRTLYDEWYKNLTN